MVVAWDTDGETPTTDTAGDTPTTEFAGEAEVPPIDIDATGDTATTDEEGYRVTPLEPWPSVQ